MTNVQQFDPELGVLLKMRERLSCANNWCGDGGSGGMGVRGHQRCLMETIVLFARSYTLIHTVADRLNKLARTLDPTCINDDLTPGATYNDTHTHTEVLELLDRAIAERASELSEEVAA